MIPLSYSNNFYFWKRFRQQGTRSFYAVIASRKVSPCLRFLKISSSSHMRMILFPRSRLILISKGPANEDRYVCHCYSIMNVHIPSCISTSHFLLFVLLLLVLVLRNSLKDIHPPCNVIARAVVFSSSLQSQFAINKPCIFSIKFRELNS